MEGQHGGKYEWWPAAACRHCPSLGNESGRSAGGRANWQFGYKERPDAVFELLRKFNREQGTTVLFVTHNAALAERCDKTIQVVDGLIIQEADEPKRG